jgi:TPR repeat protein
MLRILLLIPFRCRSCGLRFYRYQNARGRYGVPFVASLCLASAIPVAFNAPEWTRTAKAYVSDQMSKFSPYPPQARASDEKAVELYRQAADAGSSTAMANLGSMYERGRGGLRKDEAKAADLYRKAADGGDSMAMYSLGQMYEHGRGGLPKDDAKAAALYRQASDLGDWRAMDSLAVMYASGRGVTEDQTKAEELHLKAAQIRFSANN